MQFGTGRGLLCLAAGVWLIFQLVLKNLHIHLYDKLNAVSNKMCSESANSAKAAAVSPSGE